jgi:toxin ParE1/3/4
MSGLRLYIWPEAEEDFANAAAWYDQQTSGLALDLGREIDISLQKLAINPSQFPIYDKEFGIRRILVARFPYKILFIVREQQIDVCAILHSSQDNWILRQRVKKA